MVTTNSAHLAASMQRESQLLGCLLGTTVADAIGLPREGLTRRRASRLYGGAPLSLNLCCGRGLCSDDTEHTLIVARALAISAGEPSLFTQQLAKDLKCWLLTLPAGIGMATLRACLKLLVGFGPQCSGVFSAGNGPAMRSAILGVFASSDEQLRELVRVCSRITHTDPRAEEGARLVAQAARLGVVGGDSPQEFLNQAVEDIQGEELRGTIVSAVKALRQGDTCEAFADSQGWSQGISGYVNQSVPAALYAGPAALATTVNVSRTPCCWAVTRTAWLPLPEPSAVRTWGVRQYRPIG